MRATTTFNWSTLTERLAKVDKAAKKLNCNISEILNEAVDLYFAIPKKERDKYFKKET